MISTTIGQIARRQGASMARRTFSSQGAQQGVKAATADASMGYMKFAPLLVVNPFSVGYMYVSAKNQMIIDKDDEEREENKKPSEYVKKTRSARKEDLKTFKEHTQQREDTREYDEATWRRYNYTEVTKPEAVKAGEFGVKNHKDLVRKSSLKMEQKKEEESIARVEARKAAAAAEAEKKEEA